MPAAHATRSVRRRLAAVLLVLAGLVGLVVWSFVRPVQRTHDEWLEQVPLAMEAGDPDRAWEAVQQALALEPDSGSALIFQGNLLADQKRFEEAIASFERVPRGQPRAYADAQYLAAESALILGELVRSEGHYRAAIDVLPDQADFHRRLADLLLFEGRRREARPHFEQALLARVFNVDLLLALASAEVALDSSELQERSLAKHPDYPLPLLIQAGKHLNFSENDAGLAVVDQVLAALPEQVDALALRGRLLANKPDWPALADWNAALPAAADEDANVWSCRAKLAAALKDDAGAARCLWEALRRDPNDATACELLGRTLQRLDRAAEAAPFLQRAADLAELRPPLLAVIGKDESSLVFERIVVQLEKLGRPWEAYGWCSLLSEQHKDSAFARERLPLMEEFLKQGPPAQIPQVDPSLLVDLSSLPLPDLAGAIERLADTAAAGAAAPTALAFRDDAASAGLAFTYFNGSVDPTSPQRAFEFSGGGLGVVDFDGDHWPDLYCTQGCAFPVPGPPAEQPSDQLFRNQGDGTFADVTAPAAAGEQLRYGQGVAAGDYNGDGFPDLLVAGIEGNRLLANQGDGTFIDITDATGLAGANWTTSCALVDLNHDALPDVYFVNYFTAEDVYVRECGRHGQTLVCGPVQFEPDPDRVYRNLGDGGYVEDTAESGIPQQIGRGLGVVAADFSQAGRVDLFVSNDTDANYLLVNVSEPGGPLRFADRAVLAGAAYDGAGVAQSCMGVAAGDANRDGLLDLFVTNFYNEFNTLYVQQAPGYFGDQTAETGLSGPSLKLLGWGAQFLDADLDGWEDLVVGNGHLWNLTQDGTPLHMPLQVFANRQGRFAEVPRAALGSYFARDYLIRPLARWDWNRDGLPDFVVGHADRPLGLLTNATAEHGNFLTVRLRGVQSCRDPVGARVELTIGEETRTLTLCAGDGYQASNEPALFVGLGSAEQVDALTVHWPGGPVQTCAGPFPANQELLLIEGRTDPLTLPSAD